MALEKGIPGSQHNYYYNMEDPIYGEWGASGTLGAQGQYASVEYGHVARGIAGNSFYGINGLLPEDVKPGEDYKVSVVFNRPQTVLENANLSLACVIIDAATGKVLNADSIHELQITDAEINGIDSISSEGADVRFTSFSGTVYANMASLTAWRSLHTSGRACGQRRSIRSLYSEGVRRQRRCGHCKDDCEIKQDHCEIKGRDSRPF